MEKDRPILFLIGAVLLLLGIYGALRTAVNLVAFDLYPQESVFAPFVPSQTYNDYGSLQREEDCPLTYAVTPTVYYEEDGYTPRPATPQEEESDAAYKAQQEANLASCLNTIAEARTSALVNDISQSLIFLLLAFGVLLYCRVFRKPAILRI